MKNITKKLLLSIALLAGITTTAAARDTYSRDVSVLPAAAQSVLKQNFKSQVSVIKIDKDFGRVSDYEVILADGTEITFDRSGNWENVEVGRKSSVPSAFVPKQISDFVKTQQKGQKIIGIEKDRSGYEVELSNGVDMKFDRNGKFLKYD